MFSHPFKFIKTFSFEDRGHKEQMTATRILEHKEDIKETLLKISMKGLEWWLCTRALLALACMPSKALSLIPELPESLNKA